jgi:hypothetical protein
VKRPSAELLRLCSCAALICLRLFYGPNFEADEVAHGPNLGYESTSRPRAHLVNTTQRPPAPPAYRPPPGLPSLALTRTASRRLGFSFNHCCHHNGDSLDPFRAAPAALHSSARASRPVGFLDLRPPFLVASFAACLLLLISTRSRTFNYDSIVFSFDLQV